MKKDQAGDVIFRDYTTALGPCRHAIVVTADGKYVTVNALHACAVAHVGAADLTEWQEMEFKRLRAMTVNQRLDLAHQSVAFLREPRR